MPYFRQQDGTKIYYGDQGTGYPVVFITGLSASHLDYKPFMNEFLKSGYRCIYYDHRGHGASDKPNIGLNLRQLGQDLNALLDYLCLDEVIMVGHSMGATTMYSYINQFGTDRLKKMVAIDMSPYLRNCEGWDGGLGITLKVDASQNPPVANITPGKTDEDWMVDMDQYFENAMLYGKVLPSVDVLAGAALWFSLFRTDLRHVIDTISIPFLYVKPAIPFYPDQTVNFYREHLKGPFTVVEGVPGTTHMIQMEEPVETAKPILRFLAD